MAYSLSSLLGQGCHWHIFKKAMTFGLNMYTKEIRNRTKVIHKEHAMHLLNSSSNGRRIVASNKNIIDVYKNNKNGSGGFIMKKRRVIMTVKKTMRKKE